MKYRLFIIHRIEEISTVSTFCFYHAINLFNSTDIILRHSIGTESFDIHQIISVKICISRDSHRWFRRADTREKCHSHGNYKKNRKKPPRTLSDLHIKIFTCCFLLHSCFLPFYRFNRYRMIIPDDIRYFSILNLNHSVCHWRDRRVMRNQYHCHSLFPACILQKLENRLSRIII